MEKFKELMQSPRFWGLVVAAILYILSGYGIVPSEAAIPVATLALGAVGVGTIDRLGKNIGGMKKK
jgi:hypothetical protein